MYHRLIIGLSNAGKTTYAKRYPGVVHRDEARRLPKDKRYEIYRNAGVIEGIFNTKEQRKLILDLWKDKPHKVCIWIDTPYDECVKRAFNEGNRPCFVVGNQHRKFEPPSLDEGWDEIIIIRDKD